MLHRAFSVFVVNSQGQWLLQQRAAGKYHSPMLWTNACCSHPKPGETVQEAAIRRLQEELGIAPPLEYLGALLYHTDFDNGLAEHEYDHLLWAVTDGPFQPNLDEVAALRWIEPEALRRELARDGPSTSPSGFAPSWPATPPAPVWTGCTTAPNPRLPTVFHLSTSEVFRRPRKSVCKSPVSRP